MNILLASDFHYGTKSNQSKYLNIVDEVIDNIIKVCKRRKIDYFFFLGDYWNNRNTINVKTLNRGINKLLHLSNEIKNIYIIEGNHDYYYRTTKQYSSTKIFGNLNSNIQVINKIKEIELEGIKILLVPWLMSNDFEEFRQKKNYDLVLGHFEIKGFELNMYGFINQSGLEVQDFRSFKRVYSGHFHKRQKISNIRYIGSPYQVDFGEEGDTKGFTIIELPNLNEKFVKNNFSPKYKKVYYTKRENYTEKHIKNNIIRPIIDQDISEDEIIKWESELRLLNPNEIFPLLFQIPNKFDEVLKYNLENLPTNPLDLMLIYLETIQTPDDIKRGTLRKIIKSLFEETQKTESLIRKNNSIFVDKVKFRNFYSFGKNFIEFPLYNGINLVMGENGAGKTALLESIPVGFFGKPAKNLNKEDVVNKINKKDCEIFIFFHDNRNNELLVHRGLYPTFLKYYRNNKLQPQEADLRIYQNELERNILSCDFNLWLNLYFISLNETRPFLSLGTSEKRKFLEHLMDLTVFQILYFKIQNKLKQFEKKLAVVEKEKDIYEQNIQDIRNHYGKLKSTFDQLKEGKDQKISSLEELLLKIKENLEIYNKRKEKRECKIKELQTKKINLVEKSNQINNAIIKEETIISHRKEQLKLIENTEICSQCFQKITKEVQKTIKKKLKQDIKEHETIKNKNQKTKDRVDKKVDELLEKLENNNKKLFDTENKIEILLERKKNYIEQIENLKLYSIDEIKERLKELKQSTSEIVSKLKETKENINLYRKYIRYFTYIRSLMGDDQVKKFAVSKIRPWLNKLTNDYLTKVGADYQVYFDENLKEHFKLRNREIFKYGNFSGGEKRRLDLILIFSFQDILEKLRGYNCDLLVIDEFLDSNLDTEGKAKIMDIIKAKQKSKNLKVYIITHSSDISSEDFSGFIKVEKVDLFSRISKMNVS